MSLGYYKDGAWRDVAVDYVGTAYPTDATATKYYGLPQGAVGWTSLTLGGTRPGIAYSPFIVTRAMTITDAVYMVATANTATLEIYVQQADEDWQPIAATRQTIATGLDALSAGVNEITGLSVTLQPGRWLTTLYYDTNNYAGRVWGSPVPNTPTMSTTNMQNPGRTLRASDVSTPSDPWTVDNQAGGLPNTAHFVVYRWNWA